MTWQSRSSSCWLVSPFTLPAIWCYQCHSHLELSMLTMSCLLHVDARLVGQVVGAAQDDVAVQQLLAGQPLHTACNGDVSVSAIWDVSIQTMSIVCCIRMLESLAR